MSHLRVSRRLIAEAERRRRDAEEELRKREEERQTLHETYSNIKEEVEDKRAKRDKLAKQLKKLEAKKAETVEKHQAAREELEAEQREIQKQAKLFQLIIENFVPVDERERLFKRMQFDPHQNVWTLKELSKQRFARPSSSHVDFRWFSAIKWRRARCQRTEIAARPTRTRTKSRKSAVLK